MIVWKSEWINAYESPWSIFEKVCFANHITRTDLIRTLGSKDVKQIRNTLIGDKWRELIRLSGFDHLMLHKYIGYDVAAQNKTDIELILKPIDNIIESIHTWFPSTIRWCPECMRYGYHSWVHQFILTERCPFHETKILTTCPSCSYDIPFLLSDYRMDEPFTCICGYKMAKFSHWTEWKQSFDIKDSSMKNWLNGAGRKNTERFVFVPSTVSIDLFIANPSITYNIYKTSTKRRNSNWDGFLDEIYSENLNCFKAIDQYIKRKFLKNHKMCILSFGELRKHEGGDFPPICPHAYAYVLWKHTLLGTPKFYNVNPKLINFSRDDRTIYVTKLIVKKLDYLKDKLNSQMNFPDVNIMPVLHQILNRYTSELCLNYFHQWLVIAKEGSRQAVVPKWMQIEEMIEMSLPSLIFKLDADVEKKIGVVQVYRKNNRREEISGLECLNSSRHMKNEICNMESYTPSRVAMKVYENSTQENKLLRDYVDKYVSRFTL